MTVSQNYMWFDAVLTEEYLCNISLKRFLHYHYQAIFSFVEYVVNYAAII